jgi:hypothetical protein
MKARSWVLLLLSATVLRADPAVSIVEVKLMTPHAPSAAGVNVWLGGTGAWPGLNERAKTDGDGWAILRTRRTEFMHVVARRRDCDIALLGHRKNLEIGGDWLRFQRGRLDLSVPGATLQPDLVLGAPEEAPLALRKKTPGKAKLVFILQDSLWLRRTLHPDGPTPAGKVYVTGSWNNFNTRLPDENGMPADAVVELFDDGSLVENSGDDVFADGVFTCVLDLPPGEHQYVFMVNGHHGNGAALVTDPYEEGRKTAWITTPWNSGLPDSPTTVTLQWPVSTIQVTGPND